jgi:hypothetical protein
MGSTTRYFTRTASSNRSTKDARSSQKASWAHGAPFFDHSLTVSMLTMIKQSRGTIEAYHYQQLRHRKKIVRLNTIVPAVETLSNPRYVNVEELFDTPRRSVKIHDCRVVVGADMYLVTGYWYRYCDINRSVKTSTGLTWRGELTVIKTGRFIPYLKRVSRPYQADIAAAKYVSCSHLSAPLYVDSTSSPGLFASTSCFRAPGNASRP